MVSTKPIDKLMHAFTKKRRFSYQAAHRITMRTATVVARLAMIATKRSNSRCKVVNLVCSLDDNFAMTPLYGDNTVRKQVKSKVLEEYAQNRIVTCLNDKADSRSVHTMGTLKSNVLGLDKQLDLS